MRDIRFRAWDKKYKKMCIVESIDWRMENAFVSWYASPIKQGQYIIPFSDIEFMRPTGLCDDNGKQIYEGDIMDGNASITHVVIYIPSHARFMLRSKIWTDKGGIRHKRKIYSSLGRLRNKHVIGNIYESPELVQK